MKDVSFVMIVEIYCISYMLIKYDKRIFLQKLDDKLLIRFISLGLRGALQIRDKISYTNIVQHNSECHGKDLIEGDLNFNLFGLNCPPLAAQNTGVSQYIHKSHNVTILLYYLLFPEKYKRVVFDKNIDEF